MEQARSELPLSRDGADALGQSAPMAACFQLWSPRSQCLGQLREDCSYRFDPRRLPSDRRAELPRLAPRKGFGAPSPATRPPLSPSIQPIRTSLSSGGDAEKCTERGTGSDWVWDERLVWGDFRPLGLGILSEKGCKVIWSPQARDIGSDQRIAECHLKFL